MFNDNKAVLNKKKNVEFITFPILENIDFIRHAFSTRKGGVSKSFYGSMNLSLKLDDDRNDVLENIDRFCRAVGFNKEKIVMSNQTHSSKVIVVDEKHMGTGITAPGFTDDVDGMITNVQGLVLMTFYADCVPVYFVDERKKVIGICHSGWRGTFAEISRNTVELMREHFASNPEDIKAVIGPCICKDCYEVSCELADKFADKFGVFDDNISFSGDKGHIDLSKIIRSTLIKTGLSEENIVNCHVCTCCNSELLHSHRASNGKRGLLSAMMCIKEDYE